MRAAKLLTAVLLTIAFISPSLSVVLAQAPSSTQPEWVITRGGKEMDEGWGVAVDDQGYLYFVGHDTVPGPLADIFLYKISPSDGSEVWNATWGGAGDEQGLEVTVNDNAVYVGGRTQNSPDGTLDMLIQAYNATTGALKWTTTWAYTRGGGYEEVDAIVVDGEDLYVVGWAAYPGRSNEIAVLKLSRQTGQIVWNVTWGSKNWDEANGHIVVDSSRVYVAGRFNATGPLVGGEALLVAFNKTDGRYLNHTAWIEGTAAYYLGMTGDSQGLYAVGTSIKGGDKIILHKYDRDLNRLWAAEWASNGSEAARTVEVTPSGDGLIIAGKTTSYGNGSFDALLLKYDLQGRLLWSRTWGGDGSDEPHSLALRGDYAYVAGETTSYGKGKADAFLAKFNVAGTMGPVYYWLSGKVLDSASKEAIRGANVKVGPNSTVTDGAGAYRLELPEGEYEVEVYANGYTAYTGRVSVRGGNVTQSFELGKKCIIATASYGSELDPHVQFLRSFRENVVLKTFAGSQFMQVFNAWYYSFSPDVAAFIADNPPVREMAKAVLYPLIGILHVATLTQSAFSFNPELAIVMAGLVASALIGAIYFSPLAMLGLTPFRKLVKAMPKLRVLLTLIVPWIASIALIFVAEMIASPILGMASTAMLVILTMALSSGTIALIIHFKIFCK
ncbi:MAG: CFI-box-CTERM domain-containing protein [Candidatus Bathyarchaeia archaeon]